jgi:hypothetical protein
MFLMCANVTESVAFAKGIGSGPIKIAVGGGEPEIGPWERRGLAGQFRCHTPAGRQRSQFTFT